MFGRRTNPNALPLPPLANADPGAVEVVRVWAAPGAPQQLVINPIWKNPAAWGLLLVDVARHAAEAYSEEGFDRAAVLAQIKTAFDAEWGNATDAPMNLSPQ